MSEPSEGSSSGKLEIKSSDQFYEALNECRQQGKLITMVERGKACLWVFHWHKPKQVITQPTLL